MTCKVSSRTSFLAPSSAQPGDSGGLLSPRAKVGTRALLTLGATARDGGPPLAQLRRHTVRGIRRLARPGLCLRLDLVLLVEVTPRLLRLVLRRLRLVGDVVLHVKHLPGLARVRGRLIREVVGVLDGRRGRVRRRVR